MNLAELVQKMLEKHPEVMDVTEQDEIQWTIEERQRGFNDYLNGKHENPYPLNTTLGDAWQTGYNNTKKRNDGNINKD